MVELPSGTVSMLFSDVEQSTRLLTRLGTAYEQALDGFRSSQRAAWAKFGGVEMGTEGDSFFVAFSAAEDAVGAAVDAQRALLAHVWPVGEQVRVRMGIHTGSPRIHDHSYVGIDVHRAARIAAAAHGGQVVLSEDTAKLVARRLPVGVGLRDLGKHRLKDLNLPEHLHQLLIPGARVDFPPLKSLGTTSSLPVDVTPLLGRRSEVVELAALLLDRDVRLVTLTGPGGSGKTRLAVGVAREVADGFPDGVYLVSLAAVTAAEHIWSSIGEVLDLPAEDRTRPAFFEYAAALHALFVLDNLEQVAGADAAVAALLRAAPDLVVLGTSRRPLHLTGEHQYAVAPLALPAGDTLASAEASSAVQLFVDRARAVRASFALTADNSTEVAAICRRLDGLPLAIELAAARSKLLGPRALLARLDQALDLRGSDADRPTRQQTLRDTIDWSYRLLPAPQHVLFRRLGVFAGGADLDGLAAVGADGTLAAADPVDMVADLVDASLVTVSEDDDGEPRFGMLQTVRAFALEALEEAGDLEDARRLHAAYFASVATRLDWRLTWYTQEHVIRANRLFTLERNNFGEALAWATSSASAPAGPGPTKERRSLGLRLLAHMGGLWGLFDPAESGHWLEAVLDVVDTEESVELGVCLSEYAGALMEQGDLPKALDVAQRSVAILRTLDHTELAWALLGLSDVEAALGDSATSRRVCEEAAALAQGLGDNFAYGYALTSLALLQVDQDSWEAAMRLLQQARDTFENGGWYDLPIVNHNIACVLRKLGHADEAHKLMSTELQAGARTYRPLILVMHAEDYAAALADAGFPTFTPIVLAACDTARERMGTRRDQRQERAVTDARAASAPALTPTEWADAYVHGRNMSVLDALAEAVSSTTDLHI